MPSSAPAAAGILRPIFPPHPAKKLHPDDLPRVRNEGYIAQFKYDDWHTVIHLLPGRQFALHGRNKNPSARYRLPEAVRRDFLSLELDHSRYHVLDGGLLHYKTPRIKDIFILWDILVHDDRYLLGTTYRERFALLNRIAGTPTQWASLTVPGSQEKLPIALMARPHLWIAPAFPDNFEKHFRDGSRLPEIEGLVLKDPEAPLARYFFPDLNAPWMVRVRKPREDYRF